MGKKRKGRVRTWTQERIAQLRKLAREGKDLDQIVTIMKLRRTTISGQANRLEIKIPNNYRGSLGTFVGFLPSDPPSNPLGEEMLCKWPIGHPNEEGFRFCRERVVIGKPYCSEHTSIAYVKKSRVKGEDGGEEVVA